MEDDNSLNITITAVDEASSVIQGLSETVDSLSESIAPAAQAVNEAFDTMTQSVEGFSQAFFDSIAGYDNDTTEIETVVEDMASDVSGSLATMSEAALQGGEAFQNSIGELNTVIANDSEEISNSILDIGTSFDTIVEQVTTSTAEIDELGNTMADNWATVAALMTGDTTDIETAMEDMSTSSSNSSIGAAAGLLIAGQITQQAGNTALAGVTSVATAAGQMQSAVALATNAITDNIEQGQQLGNSQSAVSQAMKTTTDQINLQRANLEALEVPIQSVGKTTAALNAEEAQHAAQVETTTDTINTLQGTLDKYTNMQATSTVSTSAQLAAFEATARANESLGYSYTDTMASLQSGLSTTGSYTEAISENTAAMGIAAKNGVSLQTATTAINDAFDGSTHSLQAYNVNLKQGLSGNQIITTVMNQTTGAAQTQASTMEGSLSALDSTWNTFMGDLGSGSTGALAQVLQSITAIVKEMDLWAKDNPTESTNILKFFTALAIAVVAAGVGMTTVALYTAIMGSAALVAALPFIGLFALIVAGIVLVIEYWGTLKTWLTEFFSWVVTTMTPVWDFIKTSASDVTTWVINAFQKVETALESVWKGVENAAIDVFNSIIDAIDTVITGVNTLISVMDKIPGVKNLIGVIPLIPNITAVDDAIISPGGNVITTNPADYLIATTNPQGLLSGGAGGTNGTGGIVINVQVTGQVLTTSQQAIKLGNQIAKTLNQQLKLTSIK